MKNTSSTRQIIIGILSFTTLLGIFLYSILSMDNPRIAFNKNTPEITEGKTTPTEDPLASFRAVLIDTIDQINHQNEIDQNLLTELNSESYSITNPLIVVDPYNISPLTALVLFSTDDPTTISIHIKGKDDYSNIDFKFDEYTKNHIIPIYGLYPGIDNLVVITSSDKSGVSNKIEYKITTEHLPENLINQVILTDAPNKNRYQPGLNFRYLNDKAAFDINGDFRWFLTKNYLVSSEYSFENKYIFARGSYEFGDVLFIETNPLGRIYKVLYSPYGVHHDIEQYFDDILVTGCTPENYEDFIYEINTQTGKIENTLNLKTIYQRSRQAGLNNVESVDWFHNNAIEWVPNSDKIIISGRSQSIVSEISWPKGKIDWILSPHYGWLPMFDKYLLTPIGDQFIWPLNQHAPEILPDLDDNENTLDILLFDNGNQRFGKNVVTKIEDQTSPLGFSRMVQFRINTEKNTIEQIWQFGEEFGQFFYTPMRGDANYLPNGNRLGVFDVADLSSTATTSTSEKDNGTFFEVTDTSQIVWSAQAISLTNDIENAEYRIDRMDIYNADANDLQIGTPAINLIPSEIMEKYGINQ